MKQIIWTTKMVNEAAEKLNNGYILTKLENPFYEKTPGLRANGIAFRMTEEEGNEYIKCALDIHYFSEKYCYVKGDDGQPIIIPLRDYQRDILDNFTNKRFNILMASRQIGKCFSFNSMISIDIEGKETEISIGELYYSILSTFRKLTFLERLKIIFYKSLFLLERKPT